MTATRIAVVGGGLAGLTAARALVAGGIDAVVLEQAARPGGVVGSPRDAAGYLRETAANAFLGGADDGALALCRELGVAVEHSAPAASSRWIYIDGALRAVPSGPIAFLRSDLLTWRGKLDLLREPLRPARDPMRVGDESVHAFAARRLGAEAARALIAPFVTGIYAADAHDISLAAGFPKLAALDADGGLVRGGLKMVAAKLRERRKGEKGGVKALPTRGMWAPIGGMGALIDAVAGPLGARIQTGRKVSAIVPTAGGVKIDGEAFDGAVLALPAAEAVPMVERAVPDLATRLTGFHRAPAVLVYLGFDADAAPIATKGFGFLVAQGEALRVLGVVFESALWSGRAPAGQVLLRCIFGGGRDPSADGLDDAALIAKARADLEVAIGVTAAPRHASVVRWRHGVAQYAVGHRDQVRAAEACARQHRIALAGADYRGPGINDLCADAKVVAAEVAAWGK